MKKLSKTIFLPSIALTCHLTVFIFFLYHPEIVAQNSTHEITNKVILKSQVEWTYLNPARKDKAPMAGTLWGDRNGTEPTGFLLKPKDGFQSPPHIHNVSYKGIVIKGLIHNDDPSAANMWMPSGSFWTQPKGEIHITAAKGAETLAYIEIEEGPYLVHPSENAFDSGERAVNVDKSNIVWLDASDINWIDHQSISGSKNKSKIAFLWRNKKEHDLIGTLIKLPKEFDGELISYGSTLRAVVIKGLPKYSFSDEADRKILEPGSYFSSIGKFVHQISSNSDEEIIIYVRTNGKYEIIPTEQNN